MMNVSSLSAEGVSAVFSQVKLPHWNELPDLELYMDQVLALMERYLGDYPGFDGKGLTASMVNNYVKLGIMPAPVRKKYTREHLAHLIIICILKPSLPIAEIRRLTAAELSSASAESVYDSFCDMFEKTGQAVAVSLRKLRQDDDADAGLSPIWHAALRAQAEQALALRLISETLKGDNES